jgi:hypothetical protein
LNFIYPGMCSPAIVFIILMISHVFSRYRSIAGGGHIKIAAHSSVFPGFFEKCVWQILRLAVLSPHPIPTQFIILTCFADLCSSGPVSQTQKGERIGVELNIMPPPLV